MYPNEVHVSIVLHFHQPIGQFGYIFEEAYEKSYSPLIKTLFNFPLVKTNLHFSGPVLEWLDENHSEFFTDLLIPMINRNQVEIMLGGYYEPILVSIPDDDKKAQIKKLKLYWQEKIPTIKFSGLWLAERVWEPSLAKPLVESGIEYVLIDDENFRLNSFGLNSTFYPAITEEQGFSIKTVPINEKIRYLIPWKPMQETYEYLKNVRDLTVHQRLKKPIIVIMSDAEKFGMWPAGDRSTYDICYKTGFNGKPLIQELFQMITETYWINSCTISNYFKSYENIPLPLIYFKTESYDKMGVWALSSENRRLLEDLKGNSETDLKKFLKGSHWRNFLAKYPESNKLHKLMYFIRNLYSKILLDSPEAIYDNKIQKGYDYVLKAQCNDVYWHGQFGGIYYRFMREITYKCLIKALNCFEVWYKENIGKELIESTYFFSILLNGTKDIIINSEKIMTIISLADGGTISFLIDKQIQFNYFNVFTRQIEAYHHELGDKNKGIVSDKSQRNSFRDYLFINKPLIDNFINNEINPDSLSNISPYELVSSDKDNDSITLKCISQINGKVISIEKTFCHLNQTKTISVLYTLQNLSDQEIESYFVPEINLIIGGDDKDLCFSINDNKANILDTSKSQIFNDVNLISLFSSKDDFGYQIDFKESIQVYLYTISTFEISESSYHSSYQGNCILPVKKLLIKPLSVIKFEINIMLR